MGSQTDSQVDGSTTEVPKKAAHLHLRKKNLRRLALGGQKVKNLRSHTCKFGLDQSGRQSSQIRANPGKTESQVATSFQLANQNKTACLFL